MENKIVKILVVISISVLCKGVNTEDLDEIDRRLLLLNKPAVKSIQSEDGDIMDCVGIYKQPAFDHPALKNHIIQMKPNFEIAQEKSNTTKNDSSSSSSSSSSLPEFFQTWQKSGRCPNGTIPIRRIKKEDLLRANSLDQFGKKPPFVSHPLTNDSTYAKHTPFSPSNNSLLEFRSRSGTLVNRSIAQLVTLGYNYIGAKGEINIWNPRVETDEDHSTAQIWLKAGPGESFECVESGWMVHPKLYGDTQTRLFAHWTKDSYRTTGCFDLTCSGFIQTHPNISLGAAITPWSTSGGQQYQFTLTMYLDQFTGNWWLKVNKDIVVGYWPGTLFDYLKRSSIFVAWGGEVYSPNVKKTPHTKTEMGSGSFAETLFGSACFINHLRIIDFSRSLKYPSWVGENADEYYCYTAHNYRPGIIGEPVFYFGGPGQNPPYCN